MAKEYLNAKRRKKYTRELLEDAVKGSRSMREVLIKCGAPNLAGGTHGYISSLIVKFGIDRSHLLGQRWGIGRPSFNRIAAVDVLVYHSDQKRQGASTLCRSLLEIGREYKCFVCGIREWQKKKIILEVEHKDGDFQNDCPENVEFICPNCHSQTETYCRGKKRLEKQKQSKIDKIARRQHPSKEGYWRTKDKPELRKVSRPSASELQALIQSMPMTTIGKNFGVSDNAVRKWAKRYGLEMPKVFGKSRSTKLGA
jgi:ribosomal protein L44E